MEFLNSNSSMSDAAGLLQRCRLLTLSAGTTNQTWSINDYLIQFSDVRFTNRTIGHGISTRVEEAELYGMLCAVKMPHKPESNAIPDSDLSPENEGPQSLGSASENHPKLDPDFRGWSLSAYKSESKLKKKLPLRKVRSHSIEPDMKSTPASLTHTSRLGGSAILDGFSKIFKECRMLSTLHHPNIVQFYGVCWLEGDETQKTPAIIEELMLLSLREVVTSFREKLGGDLPLAMKLSLLSDTARGLAYLHNHAPSIIHPNLEPHDIMISTAMVAKITDLCNAQYGSTRHQDVLAFGVIAALTMGLSPEELTSIDKEKLTAVEAELITLTTSCLHADGQARASVPKLLDKLEQLAKRVPFQLGQMGTMMTTIKEWRQESQSPTRVETPPKLVPSPSLEELLKEKDRQLVELMEKNSELQATKETIEKRLAEQEEQLQQLPGDSSEVQMSDMLTELHNVVGWFLLGIHLGVPLSDLQKIRHQFSESVDQCKTEMLITYSKLKEPSWTGIVEALKKSGEHALASKIARKYGVPLPEEETIEEVSGSALLPEDASETEAEVRQLVGTIQAKDSELQNTIQQLQKEQATKEDLERELALLKDSLSLINITKRSTDFQQNQQTLSQQLFLKERERHYLSLVGMSQQNNKSDKNIHGNEIDVILVEKDTEIGRIRAQLKEMEAEYRKEKNRSEELKTKLTSLESEVAIKDAHIVELEKSKEELNKYLADERQRVDVLLMKVIPPPAPPPVVHAPAPPPVACAPAPPPVARAPEPVKEVEPVTTITELEIESPPTVSTRSEPTPVKNCCVIL